MSGIVVISGELFTAAIVIVPNIIIHAPAPRIQIANQAKEAKRLSEVNDESANETHDAGMIATRDAAMILSGRVHVSKMGVMSGDINMQNR